MRLRAEVLGQEGHAETAHLAQTVVALHGGLQDAIQSLLAQVTSGPHIVADINATLDFKVVLELLLCFLKRLLQEAISDHEARLAVLLQ